MCVCTSVGIWQALVIKLIIACGHFSMRRSMSSFQYNNVPNTSRSVIVEGLTITDNDEFLLSSSTSGNETGITVLWDFKSGTPIAKLGCHEHVTFGKWKGMFPIHKDPRKTVR